MTEKISPPNPEKVQQTTTKMRQVCREFDNLNLALDEVIAQVELEKKIKANATQNWVYSKTRKRQSY